MAGGNVGMRLRGGRRGGKDRWEAGVGGGLDVSWQTEPETVRERERKLLH